MKPTIFTPSYYKGWCEALKMAKENFLTPDLCNNVIDCVNVCDKLLEQDDFVISENRPSMPPFPGLWFWEEDGTFRAPKWSDT